MRLFFTLALIAFPCALAAQQPRTTHAQMTTMSAAHGLSMEIASLAKSSVPLWVGYSIPTTHPFGTSGNSEEVSYLEQAGEGTYSSPNEHTGADQAIILLRLVNGKVDKLQAERPQKTLDAGNLRFVWLQNVTPEDSVAALKSLALEAESPSRRDVAVYLISIHNSSAALPALVSMTASDKDPAIREKAAFWLATSYGQQGFLMIQTLVRTDKDESFRTELPFDLTLSKDSAAIDELIRVAHEDAAPRVRQQAQFWMAQMAKRREADRITTSLRQLTEDDPDVQTRRLAVFAVSQLPNGRAVQQLMKLATNSQHAEVREQAVFWLGQSKDPKALDYLGKLLK